MGRARSVCGALGCLTPALLGKPTCAVHARSRGHAWHRLSRQVLADRPRCCRCGRGATQVSHRWPVGLGGPELPSVDELDAVCDECQPLLEAEAVARAVARDVTRTSPPPC